MGWLTASSIVTISSSAFQPGAVPISAPPPRPHTTTTLNAAANPPYQPYHHFQQQQQQYSYAPISRQRSSIRAGTTGGYIQDVRYAQFLKLVAKRKIDEVTFNADGTQLIGTLVRPKPKKPWFTFWKGNKTKHRQQYYPTQQQKIRIQHLPNDPTLLSTLTDYKVDISVSSSNNLLGVSSSPRAVVSSVLQKLLFPLSIFAGLFFLFRKSTSSSSPLSLAKMKPSFDFSPSTGITFDDVAGCDGAKLELAEIVDFLKQPEAYTNNGCRIPRGVLLYGPPGTGKTLLAKAVAGEANVPFVSISGSEFVELYVGVGASRVRELFFQAKKNAPCIVFLDEIDAVGRQRGAGYAGGNDEREQTINQILVEMDGFEGNPAVITLAATNRIDILDEALMRPGRFDRKVAVDLPDVIGRTRILGVHARGKPLEPDIDLSAISRRTPGFSGAQLENLMNEAALSAARKGKATIGWEEVDGALDRLIVGLEKKGGTAMLSPKQVEVVAYHEAGHAICGALIPDYDEVQKISIIPRSNGAGGLTFFSPQEARLESGMYSKQYLESQLVVALGGRLAEELIFGQDSVTTGASNDIQQVANIASRMVKEWGMSGKVGRIALSSPQSGGPFMGRELGLRQRSMFGQKLLGVVDSEVERLVNNAYVKAKSILTDNMELLHHLAFTLKEQEVVTAEEFQMMVLMFNAKVVDYNVMGDERNREKLPFQDFPEHL
ncbi:hypothetical protein ACHAWC_011596 [Mediolabrus comicus]